MYVCVVVFVLVFQYFAKRLAGKNVSEMTYLCRMGRKTLINWSVVHSFVIGGRGRVGTGSPGLVGDFGRQSRVTGRYVRPGWGGLTVVFLVALFAANDWCIFVKSTLICTHKLWDLFFPQHPSPQYRHCWIAGVGCSEALGAASSHVHTVTYFGCSVLVAVT